MSHPIELDSETTDVSQKTKKLILVGLVFTVWLTLDLWSKDWADTTLANYFHPQPVTISDGEAGKTLSEVFQARFGWDADEARDRLGAHVQKLGDKKTYAPADKPFAADGPAADARGFYVFWRGDLESAPRRIDKSERATYPRWASLAFPRASGAKVRQVTQGMLDALTFENWLEQRFTKLDPERVAQVADGLIYPITGANRFFTGNEKAVAGDTYLLTRNEIVIAGDWFKLVYAENPGAAFSFLGSQDPSVRIPLFGGLTLIAFIVILFIVVRLPPHGWMIRAAFAGILAGAAGNFVDRVRFSYVIDFIDVDLGFYHWPTFNVADIAITVGVVVLIADITFNKNSVLASKKEPSPKGGKKKKGNDTASVAETA